jgi:hypothetical protein
MPHPSCGSLILAVADGSNELVVITVIMHPVLHDAISEALRELACVRLRSQTLIEADAPHREIRAWGVMRILSLMGLPAEMRLHKAASKAVHKQSIL